MNPRRIIGIAFPPSFSKEDVEEIARKFAAYDLIYKIPNQPIDYALPQLDEHLKPTGNHTIYLYCKEDGYMVSKEFPLTIPNN
jgi:hypothetical protein